MQPFMRHKLIAFFFISCNNFSNNNQLIAQNSQVPKQTYDTVKNIPYQVIAKPEIFETAFFHGTKMQQRTRTLEFYAVNAGNIDIRSGHLIASEPW